jgi:hypothetical protein
VAVAALVKNLTPGGPMPSNASGYGPEHQRARAIALEMMCDGDPCCLCGRPMYLRQKLDLNHLIPRALGGIGGPRALAHAACNRKQGWPTARIVAALRRRGRAPAAIRRTATRSNRRAW